MKTKTEVIYNSDTELTVTKTNENGTIAFNWSLSDLNPDINKGNLDLSIALNEKKILSHSIDLSDEYAAYGGYMREFLNCEDEKYGLKRPIEKLLCNSKIDRLNAIKDITNNKPLQELIKETISDVRNESLQIRERENEKADPNAKLAPVFQSFLGGQKRGGSQNG